MKTISQNQDALMNQKLFLGYLDPIILTPIYHDFTEHRVLSLSVENGSGGKMLSASLLLDAATLHDEYEAVLVYGDEFYPFLQKYRNVQWFNHHKVDDSALMQQAIQRCISLGAKMLVFIYYDDVRGFSHPNITSFLHPSIDLVLIKTPEQKNPIMLSTEIATCASKEQHFNTNRERTFEYEKEPFTFMPSEFLLSKFSI